MWFNKSSVLEGDKKSISHKKMIEIERELLATENRFTHKHNIHSSLIVNI